MNRVAGKTDTFAYLVEALIAGFAAIEEGPGAPQAGIRLTDFAGRPGMGL